MTLIKILAFRSRFYLYLKRKLFFVVIYLLIVCFAVGLLLSFFDCSVKEWFAIKFSLENNKSDVFKFLGLAFTGSFLILQQHYFFRRVKAMEKQSEQQRRNANIQEEQSVQQRLIEGVNFLKDELLNLKAAGVFAIYMVGKEHSWRYHDISIEILSGHIRDVTSKSEYKNNFSSKPREDIQIILDLLFRKGSESLALLQERHLSKRISLDGSYLVGADLSNAIITRVDFKDVILHKANLVKSELHKCRFVNTELIENNLDNAIINCCSFFNSWFGLQVVIKKVEFTNNNINSSYLFNIQLNEVDFIKNNIFNSTLIKVNIKNSYLIGTDLYSSSVLESNFENSNFTASNFTGTSFTKTNLNRAIFKFSSIGLMQIYECESDHAVFSNCNNHIKPSEDIIERINNNFNHKVEQIKSYKPKIKPLIIKVSEIRRRFENYTNFKLFFSYQYDDLVRELEGKISEKYVPSVLENIILKEVSNEEKKRLIKKIKSLRLDYNCYN